MKTKALIFTILIAATTQFALAQQPNTTSKDTYFNQLESLFEEGRHYYAEIGNKVQLRRVIEACNTVIEQGENDGLLTDEEVQRMLLVPRYHKLIGDYYYLNADENKESFGQAEEHFKTAIQQVEDPSNDNIQLAYYYRFVLHLELAQLYYKQERYKEAYVEMEKAEKYSSHLSEDVLLDFISQKAICKARIGQFKDAIDDINMVIDNYSDKKSESYGEAQRKKAKILMLQKENGGTGMADPTDDALKCYKEYFTLKRDDAIEHLGSMNSEDREQYWMRIRSFVVDCYRTEGADPAFLYDVTLFSKALLLEYAQSGKPKFYTWKQVQRKLKRNECAIEFVQYEKLGKKQMGALVLRKDNEPRFVKIGASEDLLNQPIEEGNNIYGAITFENYKLKNQLYSDSTLFTKIWTPDLLKAIGHDTRKLYFAPDGLFHVLAIEYMMPNAPKLTSLKTENIYRLTSTRQLLTKSIKTRRQKMLLCGGINYSQTPTESSNTSATDFKNDEQAYWLVKDLTKDLSPFQVLWCPLKGAKREIDSIRAIYGDKRTTTLTETEANELDAANLMSQYPIVHLSTHGYFGGTAPIGTDLIPASYDESLSENLIVLSGANYTLRSTDFDGSQHDGMFSAREIMQMDYSRIELIVLSACQTGLGYITDDGVYGLQRGLKNAGVKGMVLSLWSVNDAATTLLMQSFYTHLQDEDAHTAFMHARQDLVNTSSQGTDDFNHPCFYDAFILIDVK